MFRIVASALLALTVSACAFAPPSSMFASVGGGDDDERETQQTRKEVRPDDARTREANAGNSVSSLWDSVKSGLSFGDKKESKVSLASGPSGGAAEPLDPAQARELINSYRAQKGLRPLRLSPQLNTAAFIHSQDLAKSDRISHFGSDGSDTWDRVRRSGYKARVTAENVGTGQRSVSEVVRGWQKSRDHNANLLLTDAEEMGIAMVHDPNTQFKTFWTLVVGAPVIR